MHAGRERSVITQRETGVACVHAKGNRGLLAAPGAGREAWNRACRGSMALLTPGVLMSSLQEGVESCCVRLPLVVLWYLDEAPDEECVSNTLSIVPQCLPGLQAPMWPDPAPFLAASQTTLAVLPALLPLWPPSCLLLLLPFPLPGVPFLRSSMGLSHPSSHH